MRRRHRTEAALLTLCYAAMMIFALTGCHGFESGLWGWDQKANPGSRAIYDGAKGILDVGTNANSTATLNGLKIEKPDGTKVELEDAQFGQDAATVRQQDIGQLMATAAIVAQHWQGGIGLAGTIVPGVVSATTGKTVPGVVMPSGYTWQPIQGLEGVPTTQPTTNGEDPAWAKLATEAITIIIGGGTVEEKAAKIRGLCENTPGCPLSWLNRLLQLLEGQQPTTQPATARPTEKARAAQPRLLARHSERGEALPNAPLAIPKPETDREARARKAQVFQKSLKDAADDPVLGPIVGRAILEAADQLRRTRTEPVRDPLGGEFMSPRH